MELLRDARTSNGLAKHSSAMEWWSLAKPGDGMEPQCFAMICNGVEKQCGELKITKWRNQNENNHN